MDLLLVSFTSKSWHVIAHKMLIFFACYFIALAVIYSIFLIIASFAILRRHRAHAYEDVHSLLKSDSLPPITFIVPAYNESKDIVTTTRTMLSLFYRYKQIVIVNDGSTDNTLELLIQTFALRKIHPLFDPKLPTHAIRGYYRSSEHPELLVIDKENGGKADALNAGINASTTELHVCADADTLIQSKSLAFLIRPFLENPKTLVVSTSVCIANGCTIAENRIIKYGFPERLLVGFQVIEYLKTIFIERMWVEWTRGSLVVPGAFGLFRSSAIIEIGGYNKESMVEDMEIIMRLHKYMLEQKRDYKIACIPEPVAWTEAPETLTALYKQRKRWFPGTFHCLWDYAGMCFNPRYKSIGMLVIPYYLFDRTISPLIEVLAYVLVGIGIYFGQYDPQQILFFAIFAWGIVTIQTLVVLFVEELTYREYPDLKSMGKMIVAALLDNIVYHYLTLAWKLRLMFFSRIHIKTWHGTPREGYDKISR